MTKVLLGIDVGGTKTAVVSFDARTGRLVRASHQKTNARAGIREVCRQIKEMVSAYAKKDIVGIGVGVPGLVRLDGTVQVIPHIAHSRNFPLKKTLERILMMPVHVENDSRCFAFSEALCGKGKGKPVVVGVTMGTGVGGGIVIEQQIFRGADGFAGEVGHMLLCPNADPAAKGRGDVEQFLSGTALRRRCQGASSPSEYLEGDACEFLHPKLVTECAWLLTSLTHILNPSIIVLGGSVGIALSSKLPLITKKWKKFLLPGTPVPLIAVSSNPYAGALGAALLSRQ